MRASSLHAADLLQNPNMGLSPATTVLSAALWQDYFVPVLL